MEPSVFRIFSGRTGRMGIEMKNTFLQMTGVSVSCARGKKQSTSFGMRLYVYVCNMEQMHTWYPIDSYFEQGTFGWLKPYNRGPTLFLGRYSTDLQVSYEEIYSICMRLICIFHLFTLWKQNNRSTRFQRNNPFTFHFRVSKDLDPTVQWPNLQGTESKGPLKSRTTKSALVFLGGFPKNTPTTEGGENGNLKRFGSSPFSCHKIKVPEIPRQMGNLCGGRYINTSTNKSTNCRLDRCSSIARIPSSSQSLHKRKKKHSA